jgi:hypothetical protein
MISIGSALGMHMLMLILSSSYDAVVADIEKDIEQESE